MPLSTAQKKVASSKKRFRVFLAGRRVGKTTLAIRELSRFASKPHQEVWYIAPSYRMAKSLLWRKLKYKLIDLNWVEKTNESELTIDLKNGSRICLKGADNYDSLRGAAINFLVLDEAADIEPAAFYETLRPALSDTGGHALFTGTPKGHNWFYDLYQLALTNDDWESFNVTTLDGGFVPQSEIDAARELLDERTFKQEFEGSFENSSARIFYNFDRKANVKTFTDPTPHTLHIGEDFNIDPSVSVVFTKVGNVIHIIDEIVIFSSNTDEMVEEIRARYPTQNIIVYPDPSCRQRRTSAGGRTDLSILQNAGFTVKAPSRHNPVRDGINAVNAKLKNAKGDITMYVDPKCKRSIECLERHKYKEGTVIPDKDSGFDHLGDAIRYFVDYEFPIRKHIEKKVQKRWTHTIGV